MKPARTTARKEAGALRAKVFVGLGAGPNRTDRFARPTRREVLLWLI
jgi:hypothetical protein